MKLCLKNDCILHGNPRVKFGGDFKDVTIAFVGEFPGRDDEKMRLPLIGEAGRLLREQAAIAGLSEYNCLIANSAMCFIPKDNLKQKQINDILSTCRSHLTKALSVTKPKVIVTFGALAAKQIIKATSLAPIRGTFIWSSEFDCWVIPTYSPGHCLVKPSSLDLLRADLFRLKTFLRDGCELQQTRDGDIRVEIRESIQDIIESASGVSYDTETQGLDYINPTNVMISYSIATSNTQSYQVMLHELTTENDPEAFTIPWEVGKGKKKQWTTLYVKRSTNFNQKLNELRQLFESPKVKKVMMNGNYDIHHTNALFKNAGQAVPALNSYTIDIQLLAHLVNENIYARSSLEQLRKSFTTISSQYDSEFNSGYDKSNMLAVPKEDLATYAGADACVTYSAAKGLVKALNDDPEKDKIQFYFKNMVMPVTTKVLYTLEQNGVLIDMEELPNVKNELLKQQDYLYLKLMAAIPNKIKEKYRDKRSPEAPLTKTNMIREMLYTKEGLNIPMLKDKKKQTTDSVDKKIRVELLSKKLSKKAFEFIEDYNQWAVLNTLLSRYVAGIEKATRIDGKIHSSFSLGVAATGRSNSASPNLQNIPKRGVLSQIIRKLFIAPPGYVFISADASQAELKYMCHLAQDPTMLEIYKSGGDIHGKTAEAVTGKTKEEMTAEEYKKARQQAKACNFGFLYGAGWRTFQRVAKIDYGVELLDIEAQQMRDTFFETYPKIKDYHRKVRVFCHQHKYVISPLGRVRHLPEIDSTDSKIVQDTERQALNHAIQSVASDSVLLSALEIMKVCPPDECTPVLFIHDELTFQVREDLADKYARIIKHHMVNPPLEQFGVNLNVPLGSDCKIGRSLGAMVDYELTE